MPFIIEAPRYVRDGLKGLALCLMLLMTHYPASAQLPPEVQADLLQDAIIQNINEKNFAAARDNIAKYRALGVNVPPAIMMIDAKVAVVLNDPLRAVNILQDYFKKFGTKDSSYQKALALYKKIKPAADKATQANAKTAADIAEFNQQKKQAEEGDKFAQARVGDAYSIGRGVQKDLSEAVKWWRKSADQGWSVSQYNLGVMYFKGQGGLKKNRGKGIDLFRKAADQGYPEAKRVLRDLGYPGYE